MEKRQRERDGGEETEGWVRGKETEGKRQRGRDRGKDRGEAVLFFLSCLGCLISASLCWQFCPGSLVLPFPFCCPVLATLRACSFLAVVFFQFCPSCLILAVLCKSVRTKSSTRERAQARRLKKKRVPSSGNYKYNKLFVKTLTSNWKREHLIDRDC